MASSKSTFFYIRNPERWAWWSRIPRNQPRSGILHEEVLCWCKPSKWSTSPLKLWRNYTWIKYPSASSVPIYKMQSELCELFEMMGLSDRWRVCKWIADLISCWVYYTFTRSCLRRVDRVMYRFIALAQGPKDNANTARYLHESDVTNKWTLALRQLRLGSCWVVGCFQCSFHTSARSSHVDHTCSTYNKSKSLHAEVA